MGKIVGIVPKSLVLSKNESCIQDFYYLGNNYVKRVSEAGGTPVGLAPVDNWISEDQLNMCDTFVVQGGAAFFPYHFQVIHHAVTTGKKMLGICLGEQLIHVYLELRRRVEEHGYYEGDLAKAIWDFKQTQSSILASIPNHHNNFPKRGEEDVAKHDVNIVPGTLLHKVVGRDSIRLCSFHYLNVPPTQTLATINAWSALDDGVVEGVEYGDNILGIQGHPEADDLLPQFFKFVTK